MQFKSLHLVPKGCKKEKSSKNGPMYEIIRENQPEMELLEIVTVTYPFLLEAGTSISSATRI